MFKIFLSSLAADMVISYQVHSCQGRIRLRLTVQLKPKLDAMMIIVSSVSSERLETLH